MTRYVIRRVTDKKYWRGGREWTNEAPSGPQAWEFASWIEAYQTGLMYCPVDSSLWKVEPVPDQGQAEEAVS